MSVQPSSPSLSEQMREAIRLRHEDVAISLFERISADPGYTDIASAHDYFQAALAYRIMDNPRADSMMVQAARCRDYRMPDAAESLLAQALACANEERYVEARRLTKMSDGYASIYDHSHRAAREIVRARIDLYQRRDSSVAILERLHADLSDEADTDQTIAWAISEITWWRLLATSRLDFEQDADQISQMLTEYGPRITKTDRYRRRWTSRLQHWRRLRRPIAAYLISRERHRRG